MEKARLEQTQKSMLLEGVGDCFHTFMPSTSL